MKKWAAMATTTPRRAAKSERECGRLMSASA